MADWYDAAPPPLAHTRATEWTGPLIDQHAVVTLPGHGIIADLRIGTDLARRDPDAVVDVLTEYHYWHSRLHPGTAVPAKRLPLKRLWIEHRPTHADQTPSTAPAARFEVRQRLTPAPDTPAPRWPTRAAEVRHLPGQRLLMAGPTGFTDGLRALSDPYDLDGELTIAVTTDHAWHLWLLDGEPPATQPIPLHLLWTP